MGRIADSGRARDSWAALGDEWGVAEATLRLVRDRVEDESIRISREWADGSGTPTKARWEAAKSMVTFLPAVPLPAGSGFVVGVEGGRPALRQEEGR